MATKKKAPIAVVSSPPKPEAAPEVPLKAPRGTSYMLQVGMITLPVKLSAGARGESVSFTKIHTECLSPMKLQGGAPGTMYCPCCAEYVPPGDIAKGYEVSKGSYVLLTEEEIKEQKPDTDKLIVIDRFVDARDIDPIFFESSHYLSPGEGAKRAYVLVREMLESTGKVALGKATLFGHEHTIILRPFDQGLAVHKMFHLTELGLIDWGVEGVQVTADELKLAGQLIEAMSGRFHPEEYSDRYLANIKALVASKQAGTAPVPAAKQQAAPVAVDLMAALSMSLKAVKKGRAA
jgi:DNA end-binding protein Ku